MAALSESSIRVPDIVVRLEAHQKLASGEALNSKKNDHVMQRVSLAGSLVPLMWRVQQLQQNL